MEDEDDLAIVHGKGEHNGQGLCRKDLISPTVDVYGIMPKWKWITNANSFKTYAVPEIKDKTELKYHFWDRCYNLSIEIRVMQDISTLASLATHRSPWSIAPVWLADLLAASPYQSYPLTAAGLNTWNEDTMYTWVWATLFEITSRICEDESSLAGWVQEKERWSASTMSKNIHGFIRRRRGVKTKTVFAVDFWTTISWCCCFSGKFCFAFPFGNRAINPNLP